MSLNRSEQLIYDYLQGKPEERQYWVGKVQSAVAVAMDEPAAAVKLEAELWRYFEERSAVASPFREIARRDGVRRTSMRNLAEYLIRLWTAPRPKRPKANAEELPAE